MTVPSSPERIDLAVPDAKGGATRYTIECASPNVLTRVGWKFNTVKLGELPLTAAFGSNRVLNVLDVRRLLDIQRYQSINVHAGDRRTAYYTNLRPGRYSFHVTTGGEQEARLDFEVLPAWSA